MITDQNIHFDIQKLTLSNDIWKVELCYESIFAEHKVIREKDYSKTIDLSDSGYLGSSLGIKIIDNQGNDQSCLITGIDGGSYLHIADKNEGSQSVKLAGNTLILSSGFTFFSYSIDKQEINWRIRPEIAEIFEFYDLQDDYLLRGELAIHRIDGNGNILWRYSGRDIWVNIDGEEGSRDFVNLLA